MKGIYYATFMLLIIGGLNWLLVGLFQRDIGSLFGGMDATLSRMAYVLVGISAIVEVINHKSNCKHC